MKTYHKIILILGVVAIGLLSAKAYRDYLSVNVTYKVVIMEESRSLANLLASVRLAYQEPFANNPQLLNKTTHQFLPVVKSGVISEYFQSIDGGERSIRTVSTNPRNPDNAPTHQELVGLEYFEKDSQKNVFFRQYGDEYLYMVSLRATALCLECHGEPSNAPEYMKKYENGWGYSEGGLIGAISISGNNIEVKTSLMEQYKKGMAIYSLVAIMLLVGVGFVIKKSYYKDDDYRSRLEEEVNVHVKTLENQAELMHFQLYHDALTQLPNRNQLIKDLSHFSFGAIALVNVDDFKHINDLYGQEAGDEVLVSVAGMLTLFAKEHNGSIYKLHADEFAICFDLIDEEYLESLINRLLEELRRFVVITDEDYSVDISATIGASLGNENLLACADMALKRAKTQRASYLLYHPSMKIKREYAYNIEWTRKLKRAIRDDRIVPFYQGIYNCEDKSLAHYEVLMRLIDDDGSPISPIYFLPIAKKNKLYHQLTRLVIEKSLDDFALRDVGLSINLSIIDILNPETVAYILERVDSFPDPKRLSFEILESEGIENYQEVFNFLGLLKARGCSIAIDDFGAGYSSFEHMLNLHVDLLKIDASLIRDIDTNENARITTHAIVTFAKAIGVKTCAEYVHSEAIFILLKSMGVDYAQGYYLAKPLPLEELAESNPPA